MNFWFADLDGATEARAEATAERVWDWFHEPVAPRTVPIAGIIGPSIADAGHYVKVYEYDMATGDRLSYAEAPPLVTLGKTIGTTRDVAESMPSEVALCMSYASTSGATPGGGQFSTPVAH